MNYKHGKESIACSHRCKACGHRCGDHAGPDIKSTPNECLEDDCPCVLWTEGGPQQAKPSSKLKAASIPKSAPSVEPISHSRNESSHRWNRSGDSSWACPSCRAVVSCAVEPGPTDLALQGILQDCAMEKAMRALP